MVLYYAYWWLNAVWKKSLRWKNKKWTFFKYMQNIQVKGFKNTINDCECIEACINTSPSNQILEFLWSHIVHIGERCLKEISKYLISSAIWSLSWAPEWRAARSQAKSKQRNAHWAKANTIIFINTALEFCLEFD